MMTMCPSYTSWVLLPAMNVESFWIVVTMICASRVSELALQHRGGRVRVRRALLEAVVLEHGLVVEVLAIDDEQHLADAVEPGRELRRLEARQRLARPRGVPDVPAGRDGPEGPGVLRDLDPVQDPLGGDDLVGPHHEQHAVGGEHAIPGEHRQQGVPGEERPGEPGQALDGLVLRVGPPGGELERVRRHADGLLALHLLEVLSARGVAVVLGQRAVADHEDLDVVEQPGARPEAVTLVAVDLVERLADVDPATLQLDVDERQAIDEDSDVVAVAAGRPAVALGDLVLVEDLEVVVVDVGLVDQLDVLRRPVVAGEDLDGILLDAAGLVLGRVVGARDTVREEPPPLRIGEHEVVELLQLRAKVGDELGLGRDA
jgi:hypothetical protein